MSPLDIAPPTAISGYAEIAAHLRRWIVREHLAPGAPLPKQSELAERYAVSKLTIGRAMRQLQDDGFIVAIRRAGSFVAPSPPHLLRYALVFPCKAGEVGGNRFMQALANEAARLTDSGERNIECVYDAESSRSGPAYQQLVQDIHRQRLAGILFATSPWRFLGSPVLDAPGTARAAIVPDNIKFPQVAVVGFDTGAFAERAFERLREAGRQRVAVITSVPDLDTWAKTLAGRTAAYGLEHRPYWLQSVELRSRSSARRLAHLLMHPDQSLRPDALIVTDDNLLEPVSAGLLDAGVEAPRDLSIVAHANFPWPTHSYLPVARLGYDAGDAMRQLVLAADRQRKALREGAAAIPRTQLEPISEDEYQSRRAPSLDALASLAEVDSSLPFAHFQDA